jgi:hypothetical protein
MGDITNPKLIYLKGFLFLFAGLLASAAILLEHPTLQHAFLLGVAVWSFARFYYFTFYVIQHYVDSEYRFAGLGAFVLYLLKRRSAAVSKDADSSNSSGSSPNS